MKEDRALFHVMLLAMGEAVAFVTNDMYRGLCEAGADNAILLISALFMRRSEFI